MPEFNEDVLFRLPVLTRNKRKQVIILYALVLDDSFTSDVLRTHSWHLNENGYPRTQVNSVFVYLHKMVYSRYKGKLSSGTEIDHKDGDKFNALPENLRPLSHSDNVRNGRRKSGLTGYRGVSKASNSSKGKYRAYWNAGRKQFSLGIFENPCDAAAAVNALYREKFPHLDIPNPGVEE